MHNNIRSFISKADSLNAIVSKLKPSLITLNEVNLPKNAKPIIHGYFSYVHKGSDKHMGGISTSVSNNDAAHSVLIKDGGDQEYIVTRHSQFFIPINVINWYGEPESHQNVESIDRDWRNILSEIKRIEKLKEGLILTENLNKHIGNVVPANKEKNVSWW